MSHQAVKGITLLEMIIVCGVACILLAITGIAWQKASANRHMDAVVAELEAGLSLARQTAQNHNGAYITFVLPSGSNDGSWTLFPGSYDDATRQNMTTQKPISRVLNVSFSPSTTNVIQFNSAGSIDKNISPLNSDGNCEIIISLGGDNRLTTLTIIGMTGAVVKNVTN